MKSYSDTVSEIEKEVIDIRSENILQIKGQGYIVDSIKQLIENTASRIRHQTLSELRERIKTEVNEMKKNDYQILFTLSDIHRILKEMEKPI